MYLRKRKKKRKEPVELKQISMRNSISNLKKKKKIIALHNGMVLNKNESCFARLTRLTDIFIWRGV